MAWSKASIGGARNCHRAACFHVDARAVQSARGTMPRDETTSSKAGSISMLPASASQTSSTTLWGYPVLRSWRRLDFHRRSLTSVPAVKSFNATAVAPQRRDTAELPEVIQSTIAVSQRIPLMHAVRQVRALLRSHQHLPLSASRCQREAPCSATCSVPRPTPCSRTLSNERLTNIPAGTAPRAQKPVRVSTIGRQREATGRESHPGAESFDFAARRLDIPPARYVRSVLAVVPVRRARRSPPTT